MSTGNCKICLQDKPKIYKGLTKHLSGIYENELGKKWLGKVCPECIKTMFKERRAPHKKVFTEIPCTVCGTNFMPNRVSQKICGNKACKDKRDPKRTAINLSSDDMKD